MVGCRMEKKKLNVIKLQVESRGKKMSNIHNTGICCGNHCRNITGKILYIRQWIAG